MDFLSCGTRGAINLGSSGESAANQGSGRSPGDSCTAHAESGQWSALIALLLLKAQPVPAPVAA
jgi:hypothetical protein